MRACAVAAETAHQLGLGVNAGHDLDHRNLVRFRELPHLDEVSIGHALISRALFDGLSATVRAYLDVLAMTKESVALGVAGVLFGFLTGWIIGAQQAPARLPRPPPQAHRLPPPGRRPAGLAGRAGPGRGAQARSGARSTACASGPPTTRATPRSGPRSATPTSTPSAIAEAITWYEASLGLDAKNVNVSTDLGVSYYYANQADRALAQFERSLQIEPKHTKTMLNIGVVRAFGKQDLTGAASIWQQVVDIAPESAEGRAAKRMIEAVRSAHPEAGGPAGGAPAATPQENGAS